MNQMYCNILCIIQLLMQHIRACLPELRTRVNSLLSKNQHVLMSLGGPVENKVRAIEI